MTGLDAGEKPQEQKPDGQAQQSTESSIDYSKIDWSKVDWSQVPATALPEEVVKATPTAKALLEETIQRRQTIKQLKDALAEKPAEQPKADAKPDASTDAPEWAKTLIEKVSAFEKQTQAQKVEAAIQAALTTNKLPAEARKFIVGDTPEAVAQSAADLAKMFTPSDPTSAGNPAGVGGGDIQSRAMQIIKNRIEGNKPVSDKGASIFDTGIQRIK